MICLAVVAFFCVGQGFAQTGVTYTAQRRIDTITVDGLLTEASWANAVNTSIFTVWDGSVAPAELQTSAKMIWDDQYLYVGITAKDPDVYATYVGRDVRCWDQDNFEVFVTVPGTPGYVEVEGSPISAFWDGYWTNVYVGPGAAYTMTNLQVGWHVNGIVNNPTNQDIGFTGEIRFPFSDIYQSPGGHPTNGTQLRINLNRINWNTPETPGGTGAPGSRTYYTWSPLPGTKADFHQPSKFGTVTFSTNPVPAPTWLFTNQTISGSQLVLNGIGHPGGTYWVLAATNAALPIAQWTRVATNVFNPVTGQFSITNLVTPGSPRLFYRLRSP